MNPFFSYSNASAPTSNNPSSDEQTLNNNPPQQQLPYLPYSTTQPMNSSEIPQPPPLIPVHQPIQSQTTQPTQPTPSYQQPIDPTNPQPIHTESIPKEEHKKSTEKSGTTPSLVEHHYHVVFSSDNPPPLTSQPPIEPRDWENYYDEASGASSSLSLSICLSILLACVGCFPLSCIPYWFVYSTYKFSANRQAQSVSAVAKTLFWLTVMMNVCFCCISVFVIVIVPPAVVVPKYY